MARKIYTQKQFEAKLHEEMDKFYEKCVRDEQERRMYRKIDELERRIAKLENPNCEVEERTCCETARPIY